MARIIVFGPHPDDQEIGMGASIAKFAAMGHEVLIVDVTDGSPTPRGDRASRLVEASNALAALQPSPETIARGGKPIKRILLDLPNRMIEHTLKTRHLFAGAIRAHQANIVFTPWEVDAHPDHRAVSRSVEDARFDAKLTKIEMPVPPGFTEIGPPIYPKWLFFYHVSHLRATISPSFLLDVTGYEHQKLSAIRAYHSQFGPWDADPAAAKVQTPYSPGDPKATGGPYDGTRGRLVSIDLPDRLMAYMSYMGSLIGVAHAEPFITKEPVGLSGLEGLSL